MSRKPFQSDDLVHIDFLGFVADLRMKNKRVPGMEFHHSPGAALVAASLDCDLAEMEAKIENGEIPESMGEQLVFVNVAVCTQGNLHFRIGFADGRNDPRGVVGLAAHLDWLPHWYPEELITPLPEATAGIQNETVRVLH